MKTTHDYAPGWGLALLAIGGSLLQFVIIGLLGILLLVIAFGLLLVVGVRLRSSDTPTRAVVSGLELFITGIIALARTVADVSGLGYLVTYETGRLDKPLPTATDYSNCRIMSA